MLQHIWANSIRRMLPVLFILIGASFTPIYSYPTAKACVNCDTAQLVRSEVDWQELTAATWRGYKDQFIYCGVNCGNNLGLVFDPSADYTATSEGVGYGLLMAVMMNDQPTFDTIYAAAHDLLLDETTGLFDWLADSTGSIIGYGSAADADQDIAVAAVFAQQRVEQGLWLQNPNRPYGDRAHQLIEAIWTHDVGAERFVKPGNRFGETGDPLINLSYFSPAWYRMFDIFQDTDRWQPIIDQGYRSLFSTQGASLGLAPDWSTLDGENAFTVCTAIGRSSADCRYEMYYDAIRVPWRIGLDCLWFDEPRACEWSERSMEFLSTLPDQTFARMYSLSGQPIVDYQDETMVSMWLVAALAANDRQIETRLVDRLFEYGLHATDNGFWGESPFFYYNQSLAWFASALLSEDFILLPLCNK